MREIAVFRFIKLMSVMIIPLLSLVCPQDAHAYLDPGSGSYIFQILIASLLGALFAIKVYWIKVLSLFKKLFCWKSKNK